MNREVKFRGKDVFGNWVYGSLLSEYHSQRFGLIDAICFNQDSRTKRIPIVRNTVGQYTGLKDKNGVEIYEGDILKPKSYHPISDIFWMNGSWKVQGKFNKIGIGSWANLTEIIGNIHQNK